MFCFQGYELIGKLGASGERIRSQLNIFSSSRKQKRVNNLDIMGFWLSGVTCCP